MFASNGTTKIEDLIDPEVMADMISAKLESAIKVTPFAKVDDTLVGQPGDTITVPKYEYIGDAEDVAEGVAAGTSKLTTTTAQYKVKKVVKDVELTDEAVLSGYGNPVGETNNQLIKSIASKVDADCIDTLQTATVIYKANKKIGYDGMVDAIDLFQEEDNTEKATIVSPSQVTTLRKDPNFISKDKYDGAGVVINGEIGMICNSRIVPSKKIVKVEYDIVSSDTEGATKVTESNINTYKGKTARPVQIDEYVKAASTKYYSNPIVQLRAEEQTGDDEISALTIYLKRDTHAEKDRIVKGKKTLISVDKHYVTALTDESKVVLAQFNAE